MNDFYYTHPLIPLRAAVEKQKYKNKLSSEKFSLKKKKKRSINNQYSRLIHGSWRKGRERSRSIKKFKYQSRVKGGFCSLLEVMTSKKQFHSCAFRSLFIVYAPRQNSLPIWKKKTKRKEKKKMNKEYA